MILTRARQPYYSYSPYWRKYKTAELRRVIRERVRISTGRLLSLGTCWVCLSIYKRLPEKKGCFCSPPEGGGRRNCPWRPEGVRAHHCTTQACIAQSNTVVGLGCEQCRRLWAHALGQPLQPSLGREFYQRLPGGSHKFSKR